MTGTRRTLGRCGLAVLAAGLALAAAGCAATSSSTASAAPVSAKVSATTVTSVSPTAATVIPSASSSAVPSPIATTAPGAPSATPAAAPAAGSASPSTCASFAAGHAFLHLTSAKENADGTLTLTGQTATMICGGPDDFHYNFGTGTVTGKVLASAKIQVLNAAIQLTPITLAKFSSYLAGDMNVRVFAYTGPRTAITTLSEQFHP